MSQAAIRQRVRIGGRDFRVLVSGVQRDVPGEPHTDLIQIMAMLGQQPLTALDLGLGEPDTCANAWGYLTNRLTETIVQFYQPRPTGTGEMNPRLGCWGARPDHVERGLEENDCSIAVVVGISVWTPGASPPPSDQVFLEALRDTLLEVLSYWVLLAEKSVRTTDRLN